MEWPEHMSNDSHSLASSSTSISSHRPLTAPLKMETPLSAIAAKPRVHSVSVVLVAMTGLAGTSRTVFWTIASVAVPSSPMAAQPGGPSLPVQMLWQRRGGGLVGAEGEGKKAGAAL